MEEILLRGLQATAQTPFPVAYKGKPVGMYSADLVVDGRLLVEVKCVDQCSNVHLAQCINYLKTLGTASGFVDQLQSTSGGVETGSLRTLIRVHSRAFAAS